MGMTITEKILAQKSGKQHVSPGEFINVNLDMVIANDATLSKIIRAFESIGAETVFDPDKVAMVLDHAVPNKDIAAAEVGKAVRNFAQKNRIQHFFDLGRNGIEHILLSEQGLIAPGQAIIGQDSHTCTHGALGAFSTGMGVTDIAVALALGRIWMKVPESIKFYLEGEMPEWVDGKDLILHIIGQIGVDGALYQTMEFTGPLLDSLSMSDRLTMCNMAIEAGAKNAIFPPDRVLKDFLGVSRNTNFSHLASDADAGYVAEYKFDVSALSPQVACPHSPQNVRRADELTRVRIDQAVIGSCTNGKLEDLRIAAKVIGSHKVNSNVRLIVIPATQSVYRQAVKEGLIETFLSSGATVTPPTCGPCYGGHCGVLGSTEVCISTTNRNFVGRMGHPTSQVYLASPAVAAASAVLGRIAHPGEVEL